MLAAELDHRQSCFAFTAIALLYGPVADAVFWSQAEIVILLLLAIIVRASRTQDEYLCGIALGFASIWKVYPLLLFGYVLMTGRRIAALFAAVTVMLGIWASLLAFGLEENGAFLHQLWRTAGGRAWPIVTNVSIGAVSFKLFRLLAGPELTPALWLFRTMMMVSLGASVATLAIYGTVVAKEHARQDVAFGLWVSATVLLTPTIWLYHLVILLIPLTVVARIATAQPSALKLGVCGYACAEVALLLSWAHWYLRPTYALSTHYVVALATGFAAVLAFIAVYVLATRELNERSI